MLNRWHAEDREVILHQLGTDPVRGLAPAESSRRLGEHGPNLLRIRGRASAGGQLLRRLGDAFVLAPLAGAVLCAQLGAWLEGVVLGAVALVNVALGWSREHRAGRSLSALARLCAPSARVVRGGKPYLIPAAELVTGDLAEVREGDRVPADMRIFEAERLFVDESSLTGAPLPVGKDAGRSLPPETPLADRATMLFAGTVVTGGRASAVVTATGMRTELGRIASLLDEVRPGAPQLERQLADLGRVVGLAALVAGGGGIGALRLHGETTVTLLMAAAGLAATAVPVSVPVIVRTVLAQGVRKLARRGVIVRSPVAADTLGGVSVVGTDATGTLTRNEQTVRELFLEDETLEVTGGGYAPEGSILRGGAAADPGSWETLGLALRIAALCSEARLEQAGSAWRVAGDPTDGALLALAAKGGLWRDDLAREHPVLRHFPFTAERQRATVVVPGRAARPTALTKGLPETVLAACMHQRTPAGVRPLSPADRERILLEAEHMAGRALRVVGLAYREDAAGADSRTVERAMVWVGLVGLLDPPREEVRAAIAACEAAGVEPVILSGDHKLTALALAREVGALRPGDEAISGEELDVLTPEALGACIERFRVYARVTAEHRLRIVRAWKGRGRLVALTGDGVNDAPALEEADIGVAMGRGGAAVTREAARVLVTDGSFGSLVGALEEGRLVRERVLRILSYLLASAAAGMLVLLGAALAGARAPLDTAQLLWVNLIVCPLAAVALAFEPGEGRGADAGRGTRRDVANRGLLASALSGGALAALAVPAALLAARALGPGTRPRSAAFAAFALSLALIALRGGHWRRPLSVGGMRENPFLPAGIAASALSTFAAVQLPWIGGTLGMGRLDVGGWALAAAIALATLAAAELAGSWLHARGESR